MARHQSRGRVRRALAVGAGLVALLVGVGGAGAQPAAAEPVVTVSPGGPYLDLQPVTVSASGLEPGAHALATLCWDGTCPGEYFEFGPASYTTPPSEVAPDGTWSGVLLVVREEQDHAGGGTLSCTTHPCSISVRTRLTDDPVEVDVPISVAPTGTYRYPEAQIALDRTSGFLGGEPVGVTGSGFSWFRDYVPPFRYPSPTATRQMCRAVPTPGPADCEPPFSGDDWFGEGPRQVYVGQRSGLVAGSVPVPRYLELPSGPVDCARDGCTLAFTQQANPVSNRVPITYAAEWAPWPSAATFIDQVIAVIGGRPVTGAARTQLAAGLAARTPTGAAAMVAATVGSARDADVGEVTRLYRAFFQREVESAGLTYWVGRVQAGLTPLRMARLFGGTPEFRARYGPLTDAQVVTLAYRTTLNRDPSASDLAYWKGRLARDMTRADLVYSFARSPELRTSTAAVVQKTILTWTLDRRAPAGYEATTTLEAIARAYLFRRATEG